MPRSAIPPEAPRRPARSGLVITAENSDDGRRFLYHLAPGIPRHRLRDGLRVLLGQRMRHLKRA